jgi:tRNA (guanosine-2'-O-)-methyltransferase
MPKIQYKIPIEYRTEKRWEKVRSVVEKRQPDLTIVLENLNDPHNFSAVLRSCDAVGIMNIHMVYYGSQPFPKLGNKSSASAKKWIDIYRYDSIPECYDVLRKDGKKIFTTHMAKDAVYLYDLDLTQPVALVFGNEHSGVSDEAVRLADGNFLIPQVGMIQSLNISVAAAVTLYEAYRQKMMAGHYANPKLQGMDFNNLHEEYLRR